MRCLVLLLFAAMFGVDCGSLRRVKRVIGGEEADIEEWPWVVSLEGKIPTEPLWGIFPRYRRFTCGASVLNDRWLLSAGHCFEGRGREPEHWKAILGTRQRRSSLASWAMHLAGLVFNNKNWQRYRYKVDKIIIHPGYTADFNWLNDIALIQLEKEIPSGEEVSRIRKVALPQQGNTTFPPDDYPCHMVGWGCHKQGGRAVQIAHDIILPKFPDRECGAIYAVSTTSRFCAGASHGDIGICSGDSGGPLSCFDGEKWIQTGIASFTSANRPGKFPGAFTRVAMFTDWINKTIGANSDGWL